MQQQTYKPTWNDLTTFMNHSGETDIGTYRIVHRFGMTTLRIYLDHQKHNMHASRPHRIMLDDIYFAYSWSDVQMKSMSHQLLQRTGIDRLLALESTEVPQPLEVGDLIEMTYAIRAFDPTYFEPE